MFSIGATFKQSIKTFFLNFTPFFILSAFGIAIMIGIVIAMFALYFGSVPNLFEPGLSDQAALNRMAVEYGMGTQLFFVLVMIVVVAVFLAINAAVVYGTIVDLRGKSAGLGECISRGIAYVPKTIGVSILASLAMAAILIGGILIASLFGSPNSPIPALIMIVTVIAIFMLFFRWYVVIPALVVENTGVVKAFSRSADLTAGNRWKIFGLVLLNIVVSFALSFVLALVDIVLTAIGLSIATTITSFAFNAAYIAFSAVLIAVVYHDLRVAKEGLGSDQIAAVFD